MSITVVIPAYRAAHTIRRAVDSVLRQTLEPDEILVVDDGSPDGAALQEALRPYGDAVTLLSKPNGGAASARNHGIERAQGDWIAFLDADDYWEPQKLQRQVDVIRTRPEVGMVGCGWFEQAPGEARVPASPGTLSQAGRPLRPRGSEVFRLALVLWTGTLLVRRTALDQERFVTGLEPAEDRDLWVRLLRRHACYIVPENLATYVQEPGGISRSDVDRDCSRMLQVVTRHADLLGPRGVREQTAVVFWRWGAGHLAQGRPSAALPYAVRRLRLEPFSPWAWWLVLKSAAQSATSRRAPAQPPQ